MNLELRSQKEEHLMWLEKKASTATEYTRTYLMACIENLKVDLGLNKKPNILVQNEALVKQLLLEFPEREARTLALLNTNNSLKVAVLYQTLEFDRASMYRILDSFVEKEICTKVTGDIISYTLVHPDSPFDGYMHQKSRGIQNLQKLNDIMKESK